MRNRRSGVDIFEVIYKNDISQNYNGSGSPVLSSEYSANVTLSDCSSTDMIMSNCDLLFGLSIYAEPTKSKIIEYLCLAMDELSKIGIAGNPLWQRDTNHNCETLNHIEYWRQFGPVDATLREIVKLMEVGESQILPSFDMCQTQHPTSKTTPRGALTESSRDVAHVKMTPISIVELLMDVNQWSSAFYNIVSKATYVGALLGVEGSYNDRLHVMNAELHLPTTFVHTRECYFGRYSKQLTHNTWGVVDVSLEKFIPSSTSNFLKRPSGCLITEMSNGYSEVVWVEHVELEELQPQFTSTLAFGATRWLNSLVRYSECSQTLKPTIFESDKGVVIPESGRASLIKLADRMMKMFCGNISSSISKQWTQIDGYSGCTDVRVMVKNNEDTMSLSATTVVFTTSLWLDVSPNRLFDFLRHEDSRTKH
ncbi:hypothetical protein Fmac_019173 [Flemingia macrophylla]|uniref:START domain-containing protein n=1 Tax=Flemingia macrophylla TaxID=520843 RepID=A0ABD1M7H2_9FABA